MTPVVAAIIFNQDKLLIARRGPGKHLAGFWEFPGGKIENEETPEDCLLREIKEELGIKIQIDNFLADNIHHYAEKTIMLKAYSCTYLSGEVTLIDHDLFEWILPIQLTEYRLAPADEPFLSFLI